MTGMPPPTRKWMCPLHSDHILVRPFQPRKLSRSFADPCCLLTAQEAPPKDDQRRRRQRASRCQQRRHHRRSSATCSRAGRRPVRGDDGQQDSLPGSRGDGHSGLLGAVDGRSQVGCEATITNKVVADGLSSLPTRQQERARASGRQARSQRHSRLGRLCPHFGRRCVGCRPSRGRQARLLALLEAQR